MAITKDLLCFSFLYVIFFELWSIIQAPSILLSSFLRSSAYILSINPHWIAITWRCVIVPHFCFKFFLCHPFANKSMKKMIAIDVPSEISFSQKNGGKFFVPRGLCQLDFETISLAFLIITHTYLEMKRKLYLEQH